MTYKKGQTKLTNVVNIIVVAFVIGLFAIMITKFGTELQGNPNAKLSENTDVYIAELKGEDTSLGFDTSIFDDDEVPDALANDTDENKYDFSLDFMFGKKNAETLTTFAKGALSTPEFIIYNLFKFDEESWDWVVNLLNWLWRILLFVAIIYFIRNK